MVNYVKGLVALVDVGDTTPLNVFLFFHFYLFVVRSAKKRCRLQPIAAYSARGAPRQCSRKRAVNMYATDAGCAQKTVQYR